MRKKPLPGAAELRALFRYDRRTGRLHWRARAHAPPGWNTRFAGEAAGTSTPWGVVVTVKGHGALLAHRIIWKMLHGRDPDEVDHADRDPLNNRPGNLRKATRAQNLRNRRTQPGASGLRGVSRRGRRWIATISVGGRPRPLGSFDDPQAAHAAWRRAVQTLFGEFAPRQ